MNLSRMLEVQFVYTYAMELLDMSEREKIRSKASSLRMTSEMYIHIFGSAGNPGPGGCNYHVLALPLVHVFSVFVHTDSDTGSPSQVYGSIRATEGKGASFNIYDRDHNQPETIFERGTLSLIDPQNAAMLGTTSPTPILGSTVVTIDVCLKDRDMNGSIELIKGQFYLDPMMEGIENSYDKLMKAIIKDERGTAYLYYTIFRFAVYAVVEVTITEKRDESSCSANVYGRVVACYGNSRQYCCSDDESKYLETVLFDKPSDQPIPAIVGTPIKLLRSVVVMPAYSSLIIKANMYESQGELGSGLVEFHVRGGCGFTQSIRSENGCVQVKVDIENAYRRIYKARELQCCCSNGMVSKGTHCRESKEKGPSKGARGLSNDLHPSSSEILWSAPQVGKPPEIDGWLMTQVFSVCIGGMHGEVSTLCGAIAADEGFSRFFIYNRGRNDCDVVPDDKILCIQWDRPIANSEFGLTLDLKDPIQNLELCKGWVCWNAAKLGSGYGISWYNHRICSVVQGAHGYAAIHYMVFKSALSADVEVTFFCDTFCGVTSNVYGVVLARYGGHEYSTDYEKKYYQSSLFKRPEKDAVQLNTKSKVSLSKSIVAVPVISSLIVEANLRVIYDDNSHEEVFGMVEFIVDMPRTLKIRGETCHIEVSVNFTRPY